jgi:hypothetical protein
MTRKKTLIGIFDRIWASGFPTARQLTLYWKLTDAVGDYTIKLRIVHADKHRLVGEGEVVVQINDRLASSDYFYPLPPIPFSEPGRYEFQFLANEVYLGCAVVDVQPLEPAEGH